MLAIAPARVQLERAEPGDPRPPGQLLPLLRAEGVRAVSANGVLGESCRGQRRGRPAAAGPGGRGARGGGGGSPGRSRLEGTPVKVRVALVTGAARGIGAATVRGLAAAGWAVVAVDRGADDRRIPYPMGTPAELDAVVASARAAAPQATPGPNRRSDRGPAGRHHRS